MTVDGDVPNSKRIAFVGTGNYNAGYQGGHYLAKAIDGKGKVALMNKPGQGNLEERISGYEAALAQFPDMKLCRSPTPSPTPSWRPRPPRAVAEVSRSGGHRLRGSRGRRGRGHGREGSGKVGQVKIISMDRGEDVLSDIEAGVITASVAQQTALMPYYAIQILMNVNNSSVPITSDNAAAGVLGRAGLHRNRRHHHRRRQRAVLQARIIPPSQRVTERRRRPSALF